ncbi:hypothetical protein B7494_g6367 [Chlorociboria aeruginascens]|nr:hypothetical protein B7494_g6367 [Chlorociboria aeruginascens]
MASTIADAGKPIASTHTPSAEDTNNPFDTLFDDVESDEEWRNEDDFKYEDPTPAKGTVLPRITQWPQPLTNNNAKALNSTNARKPDRRYSVHKPTRAKSKGRQRKQNAKAGIKVITTFSKPQVPSPRPQMSAPRSMPHMGNFVDLAALQALDGESKQVSGGFWKSKKGKGSRAENTVPERTQDFPASEIQKQITQSTQVRRKNTTNGLRPASPNLTGDLSPSDRPIYIGITIPSDSLTEHTLSPETAISDSTRNMFERSTTNNVPETPSIIITPAQEKSVWSPFDDSNASQSSTRAVSSIYSRASHDITDAHQPSHAPPMPEIPASVFEEERQRLAALKSYFSPDSDDASHFDPSEELERGYNPKSRVMSSCTVFEEDESPVLAKKARAISISTDAKYAKHSSVSTVATRRRSRGWWNYITTPFLTRSNTVAYPESETQDGHVPVLPSLGAAAAKAQEADRENRKWEKEFSPITPTSGTTISSDYWWEEVAENNHSKPVMQIDSPILQDMRHNTKETQRAVPLVSSEVSGLGLSTMSSSQAGNSLIQRMAGDNVQTPSSIGRLGLNSTTRDIPPLLDLTGTRDSHASNGFTLPILNNPDSSSDISSVPNTVTQAIRTHFPEAPPPPYSPPPARIRRYRAILPPRNGQNLQYPSSPGPLSPEMQRAMALRGGIAMSEVPLTPPTRRPINLNPVYPPVLPTRENGAFFTAENLQPSKKAQKAEAKRRRHEKEDAIAYKAGGWWRGRGCIPKKGCYGRKGAEGRKRRRWYISLSIGFLLMIVLITVLATTLHRKPSEVIEQSQWLNLTGFPPIFTGLSTVAAPINTKANSGCVFPATQWSCDLPKELQASVAPNQPNQPNFLLQIQWDNSTAANATFANVTGNSNLETRSLVGNPVSAGMFVRNLLLRARQAITFAPSPTPPSFAEQVFLGNTTDGIVSTSKAGEPTPFYISFLSTTNVTITIPRLTRRESTNDSTNPFPNVTEIIPPPSSNSDGTAAPANLLPFPMQQPIRLYDRGLPTEHYGFYTYFDRSIFLKSLTKLNGTNAGDDEVPDDENGGATEDEAAFRCTWAQTRFLVQMWTRMNSTAQLRNGTSSSSSSSAIDFTAPGSFPYPITITIDRHGGDPMLKMLYCYGMDDRERIISTESQINSEDRGFGGTIINEAPSVFFNTSDPSLGGFDGGTGGSQAALPHINPKKRRRDELPSVEFGVQMKLASPRHHSASHESLRDTGSALREEIDLNGRYILPKPKRTRKLLEVEEECSKERDRAAMTETDCEVGTGRVCGLRGLWDEDLLYLY